MKKWPPHSLDLLILTFAAGALDALSYLRGKAFTANMTGNTVLLGISMLGVDRSRAIPCAVALVGFLLGAGIAAVALVRNRPIDAATDLRRGLAFELGALVIFCLVWRLDRGTSASTFTLLCVGACALGIQSVAVRRLKISGVVTTFITGTITTAVIATVAREAEERADSNPGLLAVMFATYVFAAAAGALLYQRLQAGACLVPLGAAAIVFLRSFRKAAG